MAGRLDARVAGAVEADNGFLKTSRGQGFGFVVGSARDGHHGTGIGLRA